MITRMPCSPCTSVEAMLAEITAMFGNIRHKGSGLWTCFSPKGFSTTTVNASLISGQSYIFRSVQSNDGDACDRSYPWIIFDISTLVFWNANTICKVNWKHEMKVEINIRNQLYAHLTLAKVSRYIILCKVQERAKLGLMETSEQPHVNSERNRRSSFCRKLNMLELSKL